MSYSGDPKLSISANERLDSSDELLRILTSLILVRQNKVPYGVLYLYVVL